MIRILIVDDEEIITDSIFYFFKNQQQLDLDLYRAYSGHEALDLLGSFRVDIVISDINMPLMDGMELMDRIKSKWPECRIVFLSGFSRFDYAYKAIQHEGVSYVLKASGYEALLEVVEKQITEIEKRMHIDDIIKKLEQNVLRLIPVAQKDFFIRLLLHDERTLLRQQEVDDLGLGINLQSPVLMLVARLDDVRDDFSIGEKIKYCQSIDIIVRSHIISRCGWIEMCELRDELVWFIQDSESMQNVNSGNKCFDEIRIFIEESLELILSSCRSTLNSSISFCIASDFIPWDEIFKKYQQLHRLLHYSVMNPSAILIEQKSNRRDGDGILGSHSVGDTLSRLDSLQYFLYAGKSQQFYTLLHEITNSILLINDLQDLDAIRVYLSVSLTLIDYSEKWNLKTGLADLCGPVNLLNPSFFSTCQEAVEALFKMGESLFLIQKNTQISYSMKMIETVKKHIRENPDVDFSLAGLAKIVHFNPSYLSRLYKELTGTNLFEYVNFVKMEIAKDLLKNTDKKVSEIGLKVGFGSPKYFNLVFKKTTNLTPQSWREQNR